MKNFTKTLMTIAMAGTLLFSGVAVSSAEFGKTIGTERGRTSDINDFLNGAHGGDGDPDPLLCTAKGKIKELSSHWEGWVNISIFSIAEDKTYIFWIDNVNSPRNWDILLEAASQNLEVSLTSNVPCEGVNANVGSRVTAASIWPDFSE